jgi:cell division protein FtsQ
MKPKTTRKNRFRKNRQMRRSLWRARITFAARALVGILALATVSGALIFAYDYFTQSPQFLARQIEVTGQHRLSRERILAIAGVGDKTNILAVNLTTTRKRLLAEPWIAEATISRVIPSGLRIHIREEEPLALVELEDGHKFLVNVAGRIFKREDDATSEALPCVQGLTYADLPVGGRPATEAFRAVMTLFELSRGKNSALPLADIRRLKMDRDIGATVYTGEGERAVKLGFGRYREKTEALRYLMTRLKTDRRLTRCQVVDLFDVNRIVVTPAADGQAGSDREEV